MIVGVILAAGASRRMGRPKAMLPYRGETFLSRLVRVAAIAADRVLVIVGPPYAEQIVEHAPPGVDFLTNPDPERGQLSSLQIALAALPPGADGCFFIPVDCPAVAEETIQKLARAFAKRGPEIFFTIPRHGDKRGHPVFAARTVAAEFLALPPTAQARDIVHRHVSRTLYVDVDDPGILADIDDPGAYRQLVETAPSAE